MATNAELDRAAEKQVDSDTAKVRRIYAATGTSGGPVAVDDRRGLGGTPISEAEEGARRRYLLAYLRSARQALDEIGILLKDGHIDCNGALDMLTEVKELWF